MPLGPDDDALVSRRRLLTKMLRGFQGLSALHAVSAVGAVSTLYGAGALAAGGDRPSRPGAPSGVGVAVMLLRHTSVLATVGGRRLLFDPSLSSSFSAQGFFEAPSAARPPTSLGPLDLVCIGGGDPTSFDPRTLRHLDGERASFLVGDEDTARRVRQQGHRRVRVLRPFERTEVLGLTITASPAVGLLAPAVGFHVRSHEGRSLWHTGLVPPLDVDASAALFAEQHPAELVLGAAPALSAFASDPGLLAERDDVIALADLANAQQLIPIGEDAVPTGLFSLVWRRRVPSMLPSSPSSRQRAHVVERPQRGIWYRLEKTGPAR